MVSAELKDVILRTLGLEEWDIRAETRASDVPGWDSLNHINVVLAVEKHFSVSFRNSELFRLRDVGDLQRLVDEKRGGAVEDRMVSP